MKNNQLGLLCRQGSTFPGKNRGVRRWWHHGWSGPFWPWHWKGIQCRRS